MRHVRDRSRAYAVVIRVLIVDDHPVVRDGLRGLLEREPEVEVVGTVPDVRPHLHRASCLVIPLRFGGGLRIRILEAMAAGLPIVCSSVASAGMPVEPNKDYLLARTPKEFAAQIGRVLQDREAAAEMAASALIKVHSAYGAEAQSNRVVQMVKARIAVS